MTAPERPAPHDQPRYPLARLVLVTGGLILALGLLTVSILRANYGDTLRAQENSLRNISVAFAAQTLSVAKAVDGTTVRAASIFRFRGAAGVEEILRDEHSGGALDYLSRLAVVDVDGQVLASVVPPGSAGPALPPVPRLPVPVQSRAGVSIHVSDIDPASGRAFINFVRPLTARDGRPARAVIAQVDSDQFQRLYSLVALGAGGSVTLFHRDGTMLVRGPAFGAGIGRSFLDTPLFRERLPRAARGTFATGSPLDGIDRLYGYDAVSAYPLVVIAGMNRSAALASWYGRLWTAVTFFVLLAAVLSFLAWRVARDARRQQRLIGRLSASEARLGNSFSYLSSIIDAVGTPVWVLDARLRIVMANSAFARLAGRAKEEVIGAGEECVFGASAEERRVRYQALLADGARAETVGPMRDGSGETRTVIQLTTRLVAEPGEVQLVNVLTDITERERAEARLRYLAEFDVLTGLPNRARFAHLLAGRMALAGTEGAPLAVLVLVFARLHEVADLLGHAAGERALAKIGELLKMLTDDRAVAARMGGAEFALLVDAREGRASVEAFASRLLGQCAAPLELDGREFFLGPVLGAALFPQDAGNAEALYGCAQRACGGHGVELAEAIHFFSPHMQPDLEQRLTLEAHLRRALELGELRLVFQPKASVHGNQVVGFEALLRWSNPILGEVSPAQFIPVAERSGLILPIGAWVLDETCRRIGEWSRQLGRPVKIAANLSPRQFYQKSLLATIGGSLERHGVSPGCLELEITETALMSREEEVDRLLHAIRALGVELSIDDFGTGYSSLAYLKRFPVSRLKVDRAFVRDLDRDDDSAAIARSIVNLARGLRLQVVAEGVETEAQLSILREMDCDQYQGFLLSRPLEEAAALSLLGSREIWATAGDTADPDDAGLAGVSEDARAG